jgi:deoxyribodipyrimidine photo-lyase
LSADVGALIGRAARWYDTMGGRYRLWSRRTGGHRPHEEAVLPRYRTAIVLFTRDLRVHDHPALADAARDAEHVAPLFVVDDAILGSRYATPNRTAVLLAALEDLDEGLRERGGHLVVRRGDVVEETLRLAEETSADAIYVGEDASGYAQRRQDRLSRACENARLALETRPGMFVHQPREVETSTSKHYEVFTPYWRAWVDAPMRPVEDVPERIRLPGSLARADSEGSGSTGGPAGSGGSGDSDGSAGRGQRLELPDRQELVSGATSPGLQVGGERAARQVLDRWVGPDSRGDVEGYGDERDTMSSDTSRLSAYLHLGILSPREIVERGDRRISGVDALVRQLCWRDFHAQVLAAAPETSWREYNPRGDDWSTDEDELAAWQEGRTGYPLVDAGMRQLVHQGWMHNRARLITASFLVKDLYIDWRLGARFFLDHLADGDICSNQMNWQWVAGTGTDSRPNRVFNPTRQAERYDPDGAYVRRWVPELAGLAGGTIHQPWEHRDGRDLDYPDPIVDHHQAVARFRAARGLD